MPHDLRRDLSDVEVRESFVGGRFRAKRRLDVEDRPCRRFRPSRDGQELDLLPAVSEVGHRLAGCQPWAASNPPLRAGGDRSGGAIWTEISAHEDDVIKRAANTTDIVLHLPFIMFPPSALCVKKTLLSVGSLRSSTVPSLVSAHSYAAIII